MGAGGRCSSSFCQLIVVNVFDTFEPLESDRRFEFQRGAVLFIRNAEVGVSQLVRPCREQFAHQRRKFVLWKSMGICSDRCLLEGCGKGDKLRRSIVFQEFQTAAVRKQGLGDVPVHFRAMRDTNSG